MARAFRRDIKGRQHPFFVGQGRPALAVLLVLLLGGLHIAGAQDAGPVSAELEAHLRLLEKTTVQIRALPALEPVTRRFPSTDELVDFLETTLDHDLPPADAWRTVQFYAAFDLLPPDADLRAILLELLTGQIGGFYDPESKVMNVLLLSGGELGGRLPLLEQVIYSHEYIHALQDQHFDLLGLGFTGNASLANPDRTLALQALIEGDATLGMTEYLNRVTRANPGAGLQLLLQGFRTGNLFLPPGVPPILERELTYPYEDGLSFAAALFSRGGWDAVNEAFRNPPESTEQVLHPERYLAGDRPQEVALQPTQDALGADWTLLWDRRLGEFYLDAYLRTQLTRFAAAVAAEGWGGDRYHLYHNAQTGELVWLLRLTWDTPQDAAEFAAAYQTFLDRRFAGAARAGGCRAVQREALCIAAEADGTLLAFAPAQDLALALLNSQQQTQMPPSS